MDIKFISIKEEIEMEGSYMVITMDKVIAGPINKFKDAVETARFFRAVMNEPVWIVRVVVDAETL